MGRQETDDGELLGVEAESRDLGMRGESALFPEVVR
jgi:hypothetical protein